MNEKPTAKNLITGPCQWKLVAVPVALILLCLFIWWKVVQSDHELRDDLIGQTQRIAQSINIEPIKELTGTATDLSNPCYIRLKNQLTDVCATTANCRFLYLLGRKPDGSVFFFVDSEPVGSKEYSPPGQLYTEASQNLLNVFSRHSATAEGPFTDRWGTWVSGFVPIHNPQGALSGLANQDDARAMVRKAAQYYRENGRERFLQEINNPQGAFRQGDLYTFVYDNQMTMLAHPIKPELVGLNQIDKKDWPGGKYFRKEIREVALNRGSGWVDYEYENPVNNQRDPKTTFAERVDDLIICAGAYKGTGPALAMLGMDVSAHTWRRSILATLVLPALLALPLVVVLITGTALFLRRRRSTRPVMLPWMQHLETMLVIAAGSALTLCAAGIAHERETHNRNKAFEHLAASQTELIASTLKTLRDKELEGLARFYESSEQVTPDEFRDFSAYLARNSVVSAWEWIPVVPIAGKKQFESTFRTIKSAGLTIWQQDPQGKPIPAATREIYYPIAQVAPLVGNESVLGFDIGSSPIPFAALTEAANTGLATATAPLVLIQDRENRKGMVIYRPVFADTASKRLRGFVAAAIRMDDLLCPSEQDQSMLLEISLLRKDRHPESLSTSRDTDFPRSPGLSLTRPVPIFGTLFGVTAHAGPGFINTHPKRALWVSTLVGLTLTAAFALVTQATLRRREQLERLVTKRTGELQRSEQRYRALHDAVFGGIAIHDQGIIVDCNQGLADLTGYGMDELIGMEISRLIAPDWQRLVQGNLQHDQKQSCEARGVRKDGQHYHLGLRGTDMPYKGQIVRVAELSDISEQKLTAEKNATLEAQLQQAHKMELVGQLAGGIAHDFNNMLTVILGNAHLGLMRLSPGDPCYHRFSEIQDAAQRSADITQQLLAFARKQTVVPRVLNLNDTLEGMLSMLRRLIGENIGLVWQPGPDLWQVKIDPAQVDQILANLCVNARNAIAGIGTITVATGNSTLDQADSGAHEGFMAGEYVWISVRDSGCGMDTLTLAHIFEPFFTTKDVGEGTGLGLATVYGAVRQNNGCINVESQPGQGTTFTIYLPRHGQADEQQWIEGTLESLQHGNETILLLEDELTILELTATMLKRLGYTVLSARSPGDAIRLANDFVDHIDLLATDVIMPEMNGLEVAQRLLKIHPEMKCLYISGYTADIIERHGMLDQDINFIQKPFSHKELAIKVRQALESNRTN